MTTLEILRAARELISVPERWTQKAYARHRNSNPIGWYTPNADCWCSAGALYKVLDGQSETLLRRCRELLDETAGYQGYIAFNDTHTHAEVLAMFDRAISIAEAENE